MRASLILTEQEIGRNPIVLLAPRCAEMRDGSAIQALKGIIKRTLRKLEIDKVARADPMTAIAVADAFVKDSSNKCVSSSFVDLQSQKIIDYYTRITPSQFYTQAGIDSYGAIKDVYHCGTPINRAQCTRCYNSGGAQSYVQPLCICNRY